MLARQGELGTVDRWEGEGWLSRREVSRRVRMGVGERLMKKEKRWRQGGPLFISRFSIRDTKETGPFRDDVPGLPGSRELQPVLLKPIDRWGIK